MYAVIMAGGSGTRFWPASRRRRPKQFLPVTGGEPMVVETSNRLGPLCTDEEQILVLGAEHLDEAGSLFRGRSVHMLGEPVGRNTAPCIGLGAVYAASLGCTGPVAFMPADHFIADPGAFLEALARAADMARGGGIATLGIVPTRPETGYGYIRRGDPLAGDGGPAAYRVSAFVEKPDPETALGYIKSGLYYWNAGIFVATPDTIKEEIRRCLPDLAGGLERLEPAMGGPGFRREMEAVYPELPSVSFDYGVMEKTEAEVFVVSCECGWSDVGSWESLYELLGPEHDPDGNLVRGDALLEECSGVLASSGGGRLVACLGMKDCLVVDSPDAVLVADRKRGQDIRRIVRALEREGRESLL